jgi:hypothetical protein
MVLTSLTLFTQHRIPLADQNAADTVWRRPVRPPGARARRLPSRLDRAESDCQTVLLRGDERSDTRRRNKVGVYRRRSAEVLISVQVVCTTCPVLSRQERYARWTAAGPPLA